MDIEQIRQYCLSKNEVTEGFPFNKTTLVFKVAGKMFALLSLDVPQSLNLKCNPDEALVLREEYEFVIPGYHMNKTHWNTILLDQVIPTTLLQLWIDHSYELIVKSLPASKRAVINR